MEFMFDLKNSQNSQKLRAHHIADGNVFCSRCYFLDNNLYIWYWLTSLLRTRLNLTISDPEKLLVMNLDKKHEASLLFLTAAILFYLMHFCDGNLNQFKNMVRNTRWAKKYTLTKKFGNLLNIFEHWGRVKQVVKCSFRRKALYKVKNCPSLIVVLWCFRVHSAICRPPGIFGRPDYTLKIIYRWFSTKSTFCT
jgi:hypothetical protein